MAEKKAFALRVSQELWDALQKAAAQDFRSVNGEIEVLLREALLARGRRISESTSEGEPPEDSSQ